MKGEVLDVIPMLVKGGKASSWDIILEVITSLYNRDDPAVFKDVFDFVLVGRFRPGSRGKPLFYFLLASSTAG